MTCALCLKASQLTLSINILPRHRPECNFSHDTMANFGKRNQNSVPESEKPHTQCNLHCLGPLAFNHQVVGQKIQLSHGCRRVERTGNTFMNGLVFSNRPVKKREMIHLRVLQSVLTWEGALRVGFTNLPPSNRILPLPSVAIPDLTKVPGHWAAPLPEFYCHAGSELKFWVSAGGTLYFAGKNKRKQKLLSGVDLSKPLWAMIDVYGQTNSIFLLGSKKKELFYTKRSCPPAPEPKFRTISYNGDDNCLDTDILSLSGHGEDRIRRDSQDEECVVCCVRKATVTLPCAHRCLCDRCFPKVLHDFEICPLCRHKIIKPSMEENLS